MCGVIGMVAKSPVNQALYDGLTVLQHRGQDAAGIMTFEHGRLHLRKDNGLVRDVFSAQDMMQLQGNVGIGHCRYPTAGCSSSAESQPFYVNSPYGISLAHNGNLTNADAIKRDLFLEDLRHINTRSDSEILLNVFAHKLGELGKLRITEEDIFGAVSGIHERCRGGYAAIAMINGYGVLGFRDPNGIRPLCFGSRETDAGTEYMIASESVALSVLGFTLIRDVAPGEAVFIDLDGHLYTRQCAVAPRLAPCIFEYVYLARPDSMLDDVSVYKSRLRMGRMLAGKIQREWARHDIDVVIPIPDTSRTAALDLANDLNITYREGFIKNRYIGRTFIMPGQAVRKKSVRQKLNPIELEFRGKNVLLLDDSIVRGTTSEQIIEMARDAGANKVYFASAAPPVRYPNVYGIDMPAARELLAHDREVNDIRRLIGADDMIYQDLGDLMEAVREGNEAIETFDCSCFDGQYVTGDISAEYLLALEQARADEVMNRPAVAPVNDLGRMQS
ncbi:MAG: amidophosphoribosyltransferase [Spiribacter salinus]|uniref:Amidophosphoribosyltransferase n=1 Tax=Spiribacter salinus TaxID=1335746 RepID=A0A540VVE7_9GAMM|nr:MAG: amidophosphoribosyltransferase [Spiribacter salinus]